MDLLHQITQKFMILAHACILKVSEEWKRRLSKRKANSQRKKIQRMKTWLRRHLV
jgi:uncharacterized membrane protein YbaN (DUF454 family)